MKESKYSKMDKKIMETPGIEDVMIDLLERVKAAATKGDSGSIQFQLGDFDPVRIDIYRSKDGDSMTNLNKKLRNAMAADVTYGKRK